MDMAGYGIDEFNGREEVLLDVIPRHKVFTLRLLCAFIAYHPPRRITVLEHPG